MEKLDSICMQLIAIGEGLKNLDKVTDHSLLPRYPEVDWKKAKGLRDIIRHHYFDVNADTGHAIMIPKSNYINRVADSMKFADDIPKEEQGKLLKRLRPIIIKKGAYFLRAGEIPQRIGFNVSGLLRLFYIDPNGKEIIKHFCVENTLAISYSAFLLREASKLYIQALEDTTLLVIDYATYRELLDSHVCWQIAARRLAELLYILKEKRESELLLNSAQERYLQFLEDYPNIEQRLNQYHIASYLAITPESLSRIRSNLK